MFPTLELCFMIAVTALLPQEVECPEQVQVVRDGEMDISVRDGGTARMLLNDFPEFDQSKTLHLAKVRYYRNGTYPDITEVLNWSPGQSLQSVYIAESYRDRVSLINTSNGIAVEFRNVRQTDVSTDAQSVYYQFQQIGLQGPDINLHIVEPSYNLKVTRKDAHGYVHLEWTAGFNDGQDTTYTVQYREMGGEWVDATEPPNNNYPNYTDIVHLPEKGDYSIRIRAANGIEPPAFSSIIHVTIEDDTILYGLLPITNWDYSEDLQALTSPSAEQLSSAVISELNKVFNNIIGYQKSETKIDGFKEIGVTCTNAGDVMVEFHITVAENEIASAHSAFWSSIEHERLGEFNIDKDRACIVEPPCKGLLDELLWLYRVQNAFLCAQIVVVALFQIYSHSNHKWAKRVTYFGPMIPVFIIQLFIYIKYGRNMAGPYKAFFTVSHLMLFYGIVVGVILFVLEKGQQSPTLGGDQPTSPLVRHRNTINSVFKRLPIIGLALNYASVFIDLGCDTSTTEVIWCATTPFILNVCVLAGIYMVAAFLWYLFPWLPGQVQQDAPIAPDDQPPAPAEGENLMAVLFE